MLRLTVSPGEYLMIGKNIKVVFLGGTKSYQRVMIEAPKEVDIVRSAVLEAKVTDPQEREKMPKYYKVSEYPKQAEGARSADNRTRAKERDEVKAQKQTKERDSEECRVQAEVRKPVRKSNIIIAGGGR
ncbi:MAG: carbon storage regulator [Muribaculum sp.]|nr:carbon storage regulator [Muribaculum sp.]